MAGRPKIFDSADVLVKAREVFRQKGYEATSTVDLQEAMGIGKGSFYQEFKGGKREVFEKAITLFSKGLHQRLENRLMTSEHPIDEIKTVFRELTGARVEDHLKGCFVGNTLVEMTCVDEGLGNMASGLLQQSEALFCKALHRAQELGQLDKAEDPEVLARCLLTYWNGFNLTRRMYPQQKSLAPMIERMLKILP